MKRQTKNNLFFNKSITFWKFFIILLIVNIIVFNWSEISWIFNHRVLLKKIEMITSEEIQEEIPKMIEKDLIKIDAIDISAPLVFPEEDDKEIEAALKKGVVHFPKSSLPGEEGVAIFLGHSSPPGWPKFDYDWIFSEVENLETGDKIEILFNGREFVYQVTEKIILEIGQDVPSYSSHEKEIILLSCWPPGKNIKRIGVRGILQKLDK